MECLLRAKENQSDTYMVAKWQTVMSITCVDSGFFLWFHHTSDWLKNIILSVHGFASYTVIEIKKIPRETCSTDCFLLIYVVNDACDHSTMIIRHGIINFRSLTTYLVEKVKNSKYPESHVPTF